MLTTLTEIGSSSAFLKLGVVIVIIIVGVLVGRIAGKAVKKLTKEIELNKIFQDLLKIKLPIGNLLAKIVSWIIYFIAVLFALDQVGLGSATLNIILIFILVVFVILLLLSIKDFIPNIIAGLILYSKGNIKKGVKIKINNLNGVVISISLLETKIKAGKEIVFIPNSMLIKNSLIIKE